MATYDTFILTVGLLFYLSLLFGRFVGENISFVVKIIGSIALFNFTYGLPFALVYGEEIYGAKTVIIERLGAFLSNQSGAFYLANLLLKYFQRSLLPFYFS